MGEVINIRGAERPSKAASVFDPIKPQHEIDREEAAQQRAALVRKIRWRALIVSVIAAGLGWTWVAGYFLVFAIFARTLTNWIWGKV